jgi:hypothetical protein
MRTSLARPQLPALAYPGAIGRTDTCEEGSMESEIRKLRAALARREGGRGRRFAPEIRRQISGVGRRLRDEGASWSGIGAALGLPTATVRGLCDAEGPGFARVEVVDDAVTVSGLVVVTPSGYRVEGLDANGAATLLRQLA